MSIVISVILQHIHNSVLQVCCFPLSRLVDGMDNGHHKFTNRISWGPVGVPCLCKQYKIGRRFFSILATCAFNGFRDWSIIKGTTTSDSVVSFMINKVAMNKIANDVLIFDSTSVNVARNSLDAIEQIFIGL